MKEALHKRGLLQERRWERGWEEHEAMQRKRMSRLTLPEKLEWLEKAQRIVRNLQASRPGPAKP
ncbi:MAG: hypothetical protein JW793_02070 [Acidobacteria bacterium]|nr:hypothetical protein [Acidobacteriota bacterium]